MKAWMFVGLLAMTPALACAPDPAAPPQWHFADGHVAAALAARPSTAIRFGAMPVTLETTTLEEMRQATGVGSIRHEGDAGDAVTWLCYTVPADRERVWLTSSEMGGGTYINGIAIQQLAVDPVPLEACPALPAHRLPVRVDGGIAPGATPDQVVSAYGEPVSRDGDWSFSHDEKIQGEFAVYSSVFVRFRDGRVSVIELAQVTSN